MFNKLFFSVSVTAFSLGFAQKINTQKLDQYFKTLDENHKVMGSFAIADKGKIIYTNALGFADVESKKKADINTVYRIGSITKTFTAVLVMKAVEDKKLSLDTKLSAFYPEIENAKNITVEQLLQHRSGIHNLTDEAEFGSYYTRPQSEDQLVSIIKKYKSDFPPGSQYAYSNSNYILLGFILEKIYKKSYAQLIQEKIAQPLQLTRTQVGGKTEVSKNQAYSYQYLGSYLPFPETDMSVPVGAGNIISTPYELLQFIISLEEGKLIKKETLHQMKNFLDDYGYGIISTSFEKHQGFGHNGGIDGFQSSLYYFPDLKTGVSFVTNQSNYDHEDIFKKMMEAALGKDFEIPDFKEIAVKENVLKKYEGVYKAEEFPLDIKIFIENKVLKGQATGQAAFPLKALSETEFEFDLAGIRLKFDADKKTMDFSQGANQLIFKKQ
ncbi:serine hydrolase domain-containing protein [Chryseobacterium sp. Alg-005]|uniref:serine hydrolase domain-containing protein n=1 Tax=Chryseobacterium sp. Alg-005 TaxID=3159516 RepID=UPI0035559E9C